MGDLAGRLVAESLWLIQQDILSWEKPSKRPDLSRILTLDFPYSRLEALFTSPPRACTINW